MVTAQTQKPLTMWTDSEDDELRALVAEFGQKKWAFICTKMSTGKGAKQCRRRWSNYLNNDLKQGGWSPDEDLVLWNGHKTHGNKWTEIAKMVGGRTDNAVKNRHAVLVKKEEERANGTAGESTGKRKRKEPDGSAGGSSRKAVKNTTTASEFPGSAVNLSTERQNGNPPASQVPGWRPNLVVKIPGSVSAEERGESNGLPSSITGGTSAPPSLEGLPTSASLTAAEIELLKQVQELISPHAEGFALPTGGAANRLGGRGTFGFGAAGGMGKQSDPNPTPHSPLDTPTVDLQQVMNWIMSVTPRAGAGCGASNGGGVGGVSAAAAPSAGNPASQPGPARATRASANAANAAETPQGQHSVLLRKLLNEKLTGSPAGSPSTRLATRATGATGAGGNNATATVQNNLLGGLNLPSSLPVSPNFTSSELNLLMNALGGGGDTPTSGLMGGINPFGRASDK